MTLEEKQTCLQEWGWVAVGKIHFSIQADLKFLVLQVELWQ
jgi:hypothetical protein